MVLTDFLYLVHVKSWKTHERVYCFRVKNLTDGSSPLPEPRMFQGFNQISFDIKALPLTPWLLFMTKSLTRTSISGWSISQVTTNSALGSCSSASSFSAYSARLLENPISTSCCTNGGGGGGVGFLVRAFFFCKCFDLDVFLEVEDWGGGFSCSGPVSDTTGVGGWAGRLASLARNWQAARAAA